MNELFLHLKYLIKPEGPSLLHGSEFLNVNTADFLSWITLCVRGFSWVFCVVLDVQHACCPLLTRCQQHLCIKLTKMSPVISKFPWDKFPWLRTINEQRWRLTFIDLFANISSFLIYKYLQNIFKHKFRICHFWQQFEEIIKVRK